MHARLTLALIAAMLQSGCGLSTSGASLTAAFTTSICESFRVYRPRKGDVLTPESAALLLGNNEARVAWGCAKLEDRAA